MLEPPPEKGEGRWEEAGGWRREGVEIGLCPTCWQGASEATSLTGGRRGVCQVLGEPHGERTWAFLPMRSSFPPHFVLGEAVAKGESLAVPVTCVSPGGLGCHLEA